MAPADPFTLNLTWTQVSPRLAAARLTVAALWLVPLLVVAALPPLLSGVVWWWFLAAAVVLIMLWLLWLIPRQVGALRYAEREDDLLIRRGIMFRTLVVVPYGRMQFVDVKAGPIDRAMGIARVQLHTASTSSDAWIAGLAPAEAARLRERLASRGEARLAGL